MEEENRKGPGLFYAVVSIATLVVAIIGATFAYFSATVTAEEGATATGQTFDISGEETSVTLNVTKETFAGKSAGSLDLVPAKLGKSEPSAVTNKDIEGALQANCEDDGYTGCHLWKVTVENGSTLANVSVMLELTSTSSVQEETNWSYAFFKATGETANALTISSDADVTSKGAFAKSITATTETNLTQGTHDYYLLVYLYDNDEQQDAGDDKDETGEYTGTVTLQVASGGQISASFTAAA